MSAIYKEGYWYPADSLNTLKAVTMSNVDYEALTPQEKEELGGIEIFIPDRPLTGGGTGAVIIYNDVEYAGTPTSRLETLEEIVGDGQQSVGSDLTDAVTQLNSRLAVIGGGYALESKGVTSVPSNTDTVIYGKVLPQGKYILSAKIYCNVSNASCYLACGGLRQQLTCPNVAYMTLCGLVTSNGTTETQLRFYQNSGSAQTRTDNFDDVYLVRIL